MILFICVQATSANEDTIALNLRTGEVRELILCLSDAAIAARNAGDEVRALALYWKLTNQMLASYPYLAPTQP